MTDNEIIKALECCCKSIICNVNCPFKHKVSILDCNKEFLDLINRLQDENDTLKNVIKNSFLEKAGLDIDPLAEVKAEAYKEFAERLKEKSWDVPYETENAHFVQVVDVGDIDNLYKELVGGDNG